MTLDPESVVPPVDRGLCLSLIVEELNTLDATGLEPADGFSADELSALQAHRDAFADAHPSSHPVAAASRSPAR